MSSSLESSNPISRKLHLAFYFQIKMAYFECLREKIMNSSENDQSGCRVWVGRGAPYGGYYRTRFAMPDGSKKQIYTHRLAYFAYNNTLEIDLDKEISHLCGNLSLIHI